MCKEILLKFIHSRNEYLLKIFHLLGFVYKTQSAMDSNLLFVHSTNIY